MVATPNYHSLLRNSEGVCLIPNPSHTTLIRNRYLVGSIAVQCPYKPGVYR